MPLITLSLEAGRTREQKRQLADAVYEALRAGIQIPESDPADWSFGSGVAQYVEAEQRQGRQ